MRGGLLANEEWCCRGLTNGLSFPIYGFVLESLVHVLWDCLMVVDVWKWLVQRELQHEFFAFDM